jgi:hypothetical protein
VEVTDNSGIDISLVELQFPENYPTPWHLERSTVFLNRLISKMSDFQMRYAIVIGATLEETEQAIREAIEFHLDGLRADNLPVPKASSRVDYVEVAA